jgi:carbon-monoxide dehydrogenase small subunit
MDQSVIINFHLNGTERTEAAPIGWTLLQFLRDSLGFYGTKCGCGIGECGSCTIIYNGKAMNSCLILAAQIDSANIWTIEGVTPSGSADLHSVQRAFVECDAVHCGFCTPGMVMSAIALLLNNRNPDDGKIKDALAGNLCRCTGYVQIIAAVKAAAGMICERDLEKFKADKRWGG